METDLSLLNIESNVLLIILLIVGGFFVFLLISLIFVGFMQWFWLPARRKKYLATIDFILLAIDIPKDNEQSPKAVEHIFSTLAGTLTKPNLYEKYWLGEHQLAMSMELVSLEGYIQFLIYLPEKYRDVVEASFYAQYPDAEISEVEDYTNLISDSYPSDSYELWGSDFKLGEIEAYPLRTYPQFEHSLSQEFKDPMASLLEVISRLGRGEYIWLQWIITPVNNDWKKKSKLEVKKIIGETIQEKKDIAYYMTSPFLSLMKWFGDILVVKVQGETDVNIMKKIDPPNKLLYLTAGEKDIIQGIEDKMSKIGFLTKARVIYAARREVFNKDKSVKPLIGALNQFNTLNMNYLEKVKITTTSANYLRVEKRLAKKQNRIIRAYKKRIGNKTFGSRPFILNIEELATVYHFPDISVKAPLLKTTESKKSEPPSRLPVDTSSISSGLPQVVIPDDELPSEHTKLTKGKGTRVEISEDISSDIVSAKEDIKELIVDEKVSSERSSKKIDDNIHIVVPEDNEMEDKGAPPANLPF